VESILTEEELAARYGVRPETARDWRKKRTGPKWFKAGQKVLYRESAVEAWERSREEKQSA
jgi:predicted DNA-binding transcriptional regulator AlpA